MLSLNFGITGFTEELTWAKNVMNISNQWGMGYSAWSWEVVDQWHLLDQSGQMIPPPSIWGQALIDAVAAGGTISPPS